MAEVKSIIAWTLAGEAPAKRLAKGLFFCRRRYSEWRGTIKIKVKMSFRNCKHGWAQPSNAFLGRFRSVPKKGNKFTEIRFSTLLTLVAFLTLV